MKKLFLFLFLLFPVLAFSQLKELPKPDFENGKLTYTVSRQADNPEMRARLANTNFCLKKYHSGRRTGRFFALTSLSLNIGGIAASGKELAPTLHTVGAITGGIGLIVTWAAERWLKRASIEPTRRGTSFVFEF